MSLLNRNHKPLLKHIEEAVKLGDMVYCGIRIIWHLANPNEPVETEAGLQESITDMLLKTGRKLPSQFGIHFDVDFKILIEKGFITEIKNYPGEYIFKKKYNKKQKEEISAACEKLLDKEFPKLDEEAPAYVEEWFRNLEDEEKRKLHITHMLDGTEIILRKLVSKEYEKIPCWTENKDYVDPNIMERVKRRIKEKERMANKWRGNPLTEDEAFVNACTLPELIKNIIEHNEKKFHDIFYRDAKQRKKFDPSKVPFTFFSYLKYMRNLRAHNDTRIIWDRKMVELTRLYCDSITNTVTDYLNR